MGGMEVILLAFRRSVYLRYRERCGVRRYVDSGHRTCLNFYFVQCLTSCSFLYPIQYSAMLRLPSKMTFREKREKVSTSLHQYTNVAHHHYPALQLPYQEGSYCTLINACPHLVVWSDRVYVHTHGLTLLSLPPAG